MGLLAAALAVFTGVGAGVGIGVASGKAVEAVSRQPEASGKIQTILIIGLALAEATAIYGLVIAFMILGKI
ncbi:MAG: ATP synthase F0 subunit C [Clostridia bacterium]|nr:ATP synthase F0 subunit C [Clostridia bacterium]